MSIATSPPPANPIWTTSPLRHPRHLPSSPRKARNSVIPAKAGTQTPVSTTHQQSSPRKYPSPIQIRGHKHPPVPPAKGPPVIPAISGHPRESGDPDPRIHNRPTIITMKIPHSHTETWPTATHPSPPREAHPSSPRKRGPRPPYPQPTNNHRHENTPLPHTYVANSHPPVPPTKGPPVIPAKAGTQTPVSTTHQQSLPRKYPALTAMTSVCAAMTNVSPGAASVYLCNGIARAHPPTKAPVNASTSSRSPSTVNLPFPMTSPSFQRPKITMA